MTDRQATARGRIVRRVLLYGALIAASLLMLLPVFSMVTTALKSAREIYAAEPTVFPREVHWENFRLALSPNERTLQVFDFLTCLGNSVCVTALVIVGNVTSCSLVAYGFVRFRTRWNRPLFAVMLSGMMLPPIVLSIPRFVMWTRFLGLYDTLYPLWLPAFFGLNAFFIFLLTQFFKGIPKDLIDAARIDGCGELGIFLRVVVPLSRPVLLVVAVFTFIWTWNDFFTPLIYIEDPSKYTLALGLQKFIMGSRGSDYGTQWNLLLAATTVTTIPIVIVFFFAQRYFVQGITMSGLKQ